MAESISGCLGNPGIFTLKREGNYVLGNPDFIWIPANGEGGTICVEVISPWELSLCNEDRNTPPRDPTLDITNLVELQ